MPIVVASINVTDSIDGATAGIIVIYQRSTSVPATPADSAFTPANQAFTAPTGWSKTIPSGTDPLYISTATFNQDTTSLDWNAPIIFEGVNGSDGGRGAGWWRISRTGNTPASIPEPTNAEIAAATGIANDVPIRGDVAIITYSGDSGQAAFQYTTSWQSLSAFIGGDLLVDGTVTADSLATGTLIDSNVPAINTQGAFIAADGSAVFGNNTEYLRWDGTNLIINGATLQNVPVNVTVGSTAPALADSNEGDIFFYEDTGATGQVQMFILIQDADGDKGWVPTTASGEGLTPNMIVVSDSLAGLTTPEIDTDVLNTNEIIASRSLQVGNLLPTADAKPASGSGIFMVGVDDAGATGTTAGDVVIGDTEQFVGWDTSAGALTIQGDIVNLSDKFREGRAGAWQAVIESSSDLTPLLEGNGLYRIIAVGAGGSGRAAGGINVANNRLAHGGGGGGICFATFEYTGNENLSCTIGAAPNQSNVDENNNSSGNNFGGGSSNRTLVTFNDGTNSSFLNASGGSTALENNAGSGGNANVVVGASQTNKFFDTVARSGGAGGTASFGSGITTSNVRGCVISAGGGGVDFLGNGADGGDATLNVNNGTAAAGGGGIWGAGGNATQDYDSSNVPSGIIGLGASPNDSGTSPSNQGTDAYQSGGTNVLFPLRLTTITTPGSHNFLGQTLGVLPPGQSAGNLNQISGGWSGGNEDFLTETYPPSVSGGGGIVAANDGSNNTTLYRAQSGYIFGGGGGAGWYRQGGNTANNSGGMFGGGSTIGGGGGGGYKNSFLANSYGGIGGQGAVFILKL